MGQSLVNGCMQRDNMDKKQILETAQAWSAVGTRFKSRLCKKIVSGEFSSALDSRDLANLLNDGLGKKIKPKDLSALMRPLLKIGLVTVKNRSNGDKLWFPGWISAREFTLEENETIFFSGENAWTDSNTEFPKLLQKLKGELRIIDPYYGFGSLTALHKFGKQRQIRFLTAQLGSEETQKETIFKKEFQSFKCEFTNIKFKQYGKKFELHDRYILADNGLIIVGGGMKDLARKESFVVFLPERIVGKHLPVLKATFEERWKTSTQL